MYPKVIYLQGDSDDMMASADKSEIIDVSDSGETIAEYRLVRVGEILTTTSVKWNPDGGKKSAKKSA